MNVCTTFCNNPTNTAVSEIFQCGSKMKKCDTKTDQSPIHPGLLCLDPLKQSLVYSRFHPLHDDQSDMMIVSSHAIG